MSFPLLLISLMTLASCISKATNQGRAAFASDQTDQNAQSSGGQDGHYTPPRQPLPSVPAVRNQGPVPIPPPVLSTEQFLTGDLTLPVLIQLAFTQAPTVQAAFEQYQQAAIARDQVIEVICGDNSPSSPCADPPDDESSTIDPIDLETIRAAIAAAQAAYFAYAEVALDTARRVVNLYLNLERARVNIANGMTRVAFISYVRDILLTYVAAGETPSLELLVVDQGLLASQANLKNALQTEAQIISQILATLGLPITINSSAIASTVFPAPTDFTPVDLTAAQPIVLANSFTLKQLLFKKNAAIANFTKAKLQEQQSGSEPGQSLIFASQIGQINANLAGEQQALIAQLASIQAGLIAQTARFLDLANQTQTTLAIYKYFQTSDDFGITSFRSLYFAGLNLITAQNELRLAHLDFIEQELDLESLLYTNYFAFASSFGGVP